MSTGIRQRVHATQNLRPLRGAVPHLVDLRAKVQREGVIIHRGSNGFNERGQRHAEQSLIFDWVTGLGVRRNTEAPERFLSGANNGTSGRMEHVSCVPE